MSEQEMDLRDYLVVLKKRWKVVAGITVFGFIISLVLVLKQPALYQTTAVIEQAKIKRNPIENAGDLEVLFKKSLNPYLKLIAEKMSIDEKYAFKLTDKFEIKDVRETRETRDMKVAVGYLLVTGKGDTPEKARNMVDVVSSLIVDRQNEKIQEALKIVNDDIANLREQIQAIKNDVEQINRKTLQKEKTDILAQSYVFQAMAESKDNSLKRQIELQNLLTEKEMEIKYYTESAHLVAAPAAPLNKIVTTKLKLVFVITFVFLLIAVFVAFVADYLKKNPL